jgi:predicted metal-dependent phosphoesterase TrpH
LNTRSKSTVDLHLHTTSSDGTFSPSELVYYAKEIGLKTIAVTDHDTVSGIDEAFETASQTGIELIPGIEMGTDAGGTDIHILGYFIDYKNAWYVDYLDELKSLRLVRAKEMIKRLNNIGVHITLDEVLDVSKGGVLIRSHIAKVIVSKGYARNIKDVFDTYLGRDKPCYVQKYNYSSHDVISAILRTGGIPVLAHPSISNADDHIPELVENGIQGIEAYCYDNNKASTEKYLRIADEYGLIVTGGSDDHGPHTPGRFLIGHVDVPDTILEPLKSLATHR